MSTKLKAHSTQHTAQKRTGHRTQDTGHRTQDTGHSTKHRAQRRSTKHKAQTHSTKHNNTAQHSAARARARAHGNGATLSKCTRHEASKCVQCTHNLLDASAAASFVHSHARISYLTRLASPTLREDTHTSSKTRLLHGCWFGNNDSLRFPRVEIECPPALTVSRLL